MRKIAIFFLSFDKGGAEKTAINLAKALSINGFLIDILIVNHVYSDFFKFLSSSIKIISFPFKSNLEKEILIYLKETKPCVFILWKGFEKLSSGFLKLSKKYTKIIIRVGTTFSERNRHKNILARIISKLILKRNVKLIDEVIAVSKGVAEDIIKITNVPKEKVHILPNPTIIPEIFDLAKEEIDHEWFKRKDFLKVLSVGGLKKSKDFPTLVKAFSIVRKRLPAKLIILGEGRQRKRIETAIRKLELEEHVWLPGFKDNPYSFMAKSDVFVLSSRWEGSPNVLIEAMALGTPVVSTDCPSGPKEILSNGKYGILVPVGDERKLAEAIIETLNNPLSKNLLKEAVKKYDYIESAKSYLKVFGLG